MDFQSPGPLAMPSAMLGFEQRIHGVNHAPFLFLSFFFFFFPLSALTVMRIADTWPD